MSIITADSIIITKIADIAMSDTAGVSDFFKLMIPKIPAIILLVVVKKCIDNSGEVYTTIISSLKFVARKTLYKTIEIENCDSTYEIGFHLKSICETYKPIFDNLSLPIVFEKQTETISVVSYIPWYNPHDNLIHKCHVDADIKHLVFLAAATKGKTVFNKLHLTDGKLSYKPSTCSVLYPSSNYTYLSDIITSHCTVSKLVDSYPVLGILIDGCPGLGKTKFADYAADTKLVGHIYKIDMTTMLTLSFDHILTQAYHNINVLNDTMFVIDELDKYIDYRVKVTHEQMLEKKSKEEVKNANIAIQTFEQYEQQEKITFLYQMLSILERDGLSKSCIVVFCSNNFHSIFEGVELTHFASLYDRFLKVNFHKCNHAEIVNYILYYNEKIKESSFYCEIDRETLENTLRKDVEVTHRTLHHISVQTKYNALQMVDKINRHDTEDDSGESLVDRVKKIKDAKVKVHSDRCLLPNTLMNIETKEKVVEVAQKQKNCPYCGNDGFCMCNDKCGHCEALIKDCECDGESENEKEVEKEELAAAIKKGPYCPYCESKDCIDKNCVERKNLPEHEIVWYEKYCLHESVQRCPENEKEYVAKIKEYLSKCENASGKGAKTSITVELFNYLAHEAFPLVVCNDNFRASMQAKIHEFHQHNPEVFTVFTPKTKEFVYALTGIVS